MWVFRSANLWTKAPRARRILSKPWHYAFKFRKLWSSCFDVGADCNDGWSAQFLSELGHVFNGAMNVGCRGAKQLRGWHVQWREQSFLQVLSKAHVYKFRNIFCGHVVTRVRIHTLALWANDARFSIEPITACMTQQVAKRATRLANWIVERNRSVFNGNQCCPSGHHFGNGS